MRNSSALGKDNINPDAIEHFSFVGVDLIVIITITYFFFSELQLSGVSLLISKVFYAHAIFPSFQYWNLKKQNNKTLGNIERLNSTQNLHWWTSLQQVKVLNQINCVVVANFTYKGSSEIIPWHTKVFFLAI